MSTSSRATTSIPAGLGIDLFPCIPSDSSTDLVSLNYLKQHLEQEHNIVTASRERIINSSVSASSMSSLPYPGSEPQASATQIISQTRPYLGSNLSSNQLCRNGDSKGSNISSTGTLIPSNSYASGNAVELNTILGNAHSRLKSGAKLLQPLESEFDIIPQEERIIALEKAKSRSRVDLDIFLDTNMCVEGGLFQGAIKVRIRKHPKKQHPMLISGGKIRVIGFESIDAEGERYTFYQCSASLSDVTSGLGGLYSSKADQEGFSMSKEGIHSFRFAFQIARSAENGTPKGSAIIQPGISVRYIAMVSFRIKDPISGKRSIAHFYRDCIIWPRLNPSIVLAPTSRPLQLTVSDGLRMGGSGEVYLTASLHRLHWVAGQFCHIQMKVANNSKKHLKTVSFELMRTLTMFKLVHKPDGDEPHFRSSHTTKQVAQCTLSVGERGTRGHASAKGWWAGIAPDETQTFAHQILIPHDALSISRGKLLQVAYSIRVTISAGTLLPTDIHVSLPLEIINFVSIDPPPISSITAPSGKNQQRSQEHESDSMAEMRSRYSDAQSTSQEAFESGPEDQDDDDISDEEDSDCLIQNDADEFVQHAVASARIDPEYGENAPRFADLYYSSLQENLDRAAEQFFDKHGQEPGKSGVVVRDAQHEVTHKLNTFAARVDEKKAKRKVDTVPTEASRSQQDLAAEANTRLPKTPYAAGTNRHSARPSAGAPSRPIPTEQQSSHKPTRSTVSGVALPDVYTPRPRWEEPGTPRLESGGHGSRASDQDALLCKESPEKNKAASKSRPTTPARRPPVGLSSPSIPRAGSVRDKIRELEVMAAQSVDDED